MKTKTTFFLLLLFGVKASLLAFPMDGLGETYSTITSSLRTDEHTGSDESRSNARSEDGAGAAGEGDRALQPERSSMLAVPKETSAPSITEKGEASAGAGSLNQAVRVTSAGIAEDSSSDEESVVDDESSNATIRRGGLSNNRADCFINSSLQLCKAFKEQLDRDALTRMPSLSRFLEEGLNTDEECRVLRHEMATEVIKGDQDLQRAIKDGTAQTHQDAAAFLRLLLAETKAPNLSLEERLENSVTGEVRTTPAIQSQAILQVALPPNQGSAIAIQDVIQNQLRSTREQRWIDEDKTSPEVTVRSQLNLRNDSIPPTLVVSLGRFGFDGRGVKNKVTISGLKESIIIPSANGEPITYEPTAIICHIGDSLEVGHYVCYRKENGTWLLFNDNKDVAVPVAIKSNFAPKNCYVISYSRVSNGEPNATSGGASLSIPGSSAILDSHMSSTVLPSADSENQEEPNYEIKKIAQDAFCKIIANNRKTLAKRYKAADKLWKEKVDQLKKKEPLKKDISELEKDVSNIQKSYSNSGYIEQVPSAIGKIATTIEEMIGPIGPFLNISAIDGGVSAPVSLATGVAKKFYNMLPNLDLGKLEEEHAVKELELKKQELKEFKTDLLVSLSNAAEEAEKQAKLAEEEATTKLAKKLINMPSISANDTEWEEWATNFTKGLDIDKSLTDQIIAKARSNPEWVRSQAQAAWKKEVDILRNDIESLKKDIDPNTKEPQDPNIKELKKLEKIFKIKCIALEKAKKEELGIQQALKDANSAKEEVKPSIEKLQKIKERLTEKLSNLSELASSEQNDEKSDDNIGIEIGDNIEVKRKKITCRLNEVNEQLVEPQRIYEEAQKLIKAAELELEQCKQATVEKREATNKATEPYQAQKDIVLRNINRAEHRYNSSLSAGKTTFGGRWPEMIPYTDFPSFIWYKKQ